MTRRLLIAALFCCALPLALDLTGPVRAVGGFVLAYYLPGFACLLFLGYRKRPLLDNLFVPLLISPVCTSLLTLAFHAVSGSLGAAVRLATASWFLLLIAALAMGRDHTEGREPDAPRAVLLLCLIFSGLVCCSYLVNHFLVVRSDAWYHASVVSEILDRGIPPLEPRFPDIPIRYMWIYHLFLAAARELSGSSLFQTLAAFNVVSAFAFPYLAARFASFLTARRSALIIAPVFSIAGLESASWILWPVILVRSFTGEVRGMQEVSRIIADIELDGVQVIHHVSPFGTWMVNLIDKFLTITAFSHSLNLFLLCFVLVLSADRRSSLEKRVVGLVFIVIIGAFLFHVITGAALILAIVGTGILLAMRERVRGGRVPVLHTLVLPATALIAAACVAPYLASIMGGGQSGALSRHILHIGLRNILTIAVPLAILCWPVREVFRKMRAGRPNSYTILRAWILSLLVLNIFTNLPTRNESKLVFPLFIMLTPPIAITVLEKIGESGRRKAVALTIGIFLLFFIPPILTVRGFIMAEPTAPVDVKRSDTPAEERELMGWIESNTEINATIIENNEYHLMPVIAHRRNFYPRRSAITVLGYGGTKVETYERIRDGLFSGEALADTLIGDMRGIRVDCYIVLWCEDFAADPHAARRFDRHPEWFEKVYENSAGRIYRFRRHENARQEEAAGDDQGEDRTGEGNPE